MIISYIILHDKFSSMEAIFGYGAYYLVLWLLGSRERAQAFYEHSVLYQVVIVLAQLVVRVLLYVRSVVLELCLGASPFHVPWASFRLQ